MPNHKTPLRHIVFAVLAAALPTIVPTLHGAEHWDAPDRAQRVMQLRPGAKIPSLTPENLFAEWSRRQVEKWHTENPDRTIETVCELAGAPRDPQLPIVCSFESDTEPGWTLKPNGSARIERTPEHATHGKKALRFSATAGKYSGVFFEPSQQDWTPIHAFVVDVYLEGPATRLGSRLQANETHYWSAGLQPGLNRDVVIPIHQAQGKVDITAVQNILLYAKPDADCRLSLDNLRRQTQPAPKLLSDEEIALDFPRRIAPYGRLRSGKVDDPWKAKHVLATGPPANWAGYCPFCQSRTMGLRFDPANRYHAVATCCGKDLYGADYPEDYDLKPTTTVGFTDLDGNVVEVPTTLYTDANGAVWELYLPNVFANKRWYDIAMLCDKYTQAFVQSGDPALAWKIALILDKVSDTYYSLPPCYGNEICTGKDGKPLTRAEWEAIERPAIFQLSSLGPWNRRSPMFNRGWLRLANEAIWAEPFARVRHRPAFKHYSKKVHDAPDALDRKVRRQLMREISLSWESICSQRMVSNYQDAIYTSELLMAILAERQAMIDYVVPNTELTLYNHYYHDGLCGEGAENYMAMPGHYYFPNLRKPEGVWRALYPDFLEDQPFFATAEAEWKKLKSLRGVGFEFADQHIYAFRGFQADAEKVRQSEKTPSLNWPAWGLGVVRIGGPGNRMELTMTYTRTAQHTAMDPLGIACWVDGVPVMRPGGYAHHPVLPLQWERPEIRALKTMGYPKEIVEAKFRDLAFGGWTHSPLAQNTISVNETFPSMGWSDNRGYGELIAYKGGEAPGDPGARFQVLEARDRYSFERVGQPIDEFRRAILAIQAPDGRPYAVDVLTVRADKRIALYNSAWAERADQDLPQAVKQADNLLEVVTPGADMRIQGDLPFPTQWTVFGPLERDTPEPDFAAMRKIPSVLAVGERRLIGADARLGGGTLDLGPLMGGNVSGKTAYALAIIQAPEDTQVTLGAGADWWMKWWVDGQVVCDTTQTGNETHPPTIYDRAFAASLKKGPNLIAVKVVSGKASFVLAAGGPRELRGGGNTASRARNTRDRVMQHAKKCQILENPSRPWSVTWKTDYAAYAPRDPHGKPFVRPLPDDVGKVETRFIGVPDPDGKTGLIRARGPWVSIIDQPLKNGGKLKTNVGFLDATDLLVETRPAAPQGATHRFTHVIEGYPQGRRSAIESVRSLATAADTDGPVVLEIRRRDGMRDVVVYQQEPRAIQFAQGFVTDARYALVRLGADGRAVEVHAVEATHLRGPGIDLSGPARFAGSIVDVIGDLTGTRQESALIVKPDGPWPAQLPDGCRQAVVSGPNPLRAPFREAYAIEAVHPQPEGAVRLEIKGVAPLAVGWHQVTELDGKQPNFFRTNRPMLAGSCSPWYAGMSVWFPRIAKTFRFEDLTGGWHHSTDAILHDVDLAAEGVQEGDWYLVHFVEPGMQVHVANVLQWQR